MSPEALPVETGTLRATAMTTSAATESVGAGTSTESAETRETSSTEEGRTETSEEAKTESPRASANILRQRSQRARRSAARPQTREIGTGRETRREVSAPAPLRGPRLHLPLEQEHRLCRARATAAGTAGTGTKIGTAVVETVATAVIAIPASEEKERLSAVVTAAAVRIIAEMHVTLIEVILVDRLFFLFAC